MTLARHPPYIFADFFTLCHQINLYPRYISYKMHQKGKKLKRTHSRTSEASFITSVDSIYTAAYESCNFAFHQTIAEHRPLQSLFYCHPEHINLPNKIADSEQVLFSKEYREYPSCHSCATTAQYDDSPPLTQPPNAFWELGKGR